MFLPRAALPRWLAAVCPPHSNTSGRCPACGCCPLHQPPAAWLLAPPHLCPSPSQQRGCSGDLWLLGGLRALPLQTVQLHPQADRWLSASSPTGRPCRPALLILLPPRSLLPPSPPPQTLLSTGPVCPFSVPALTLHPGPGMSPREALPPPAWKPTPASCHRCGLHSPVLSLREHQLRLSAFLARPVPVGRPKRAGAGARPRSQQRRSRQAPVGAICQGA